MNRDLLLRLLNDNWQRLANCMQEQSVDVVVSAYPPDVRYLAGPGPFVTRVMAEAVGMEVVTFDERSRRPTLVTMEGYVPYYRDMLSEASILSFSEVDKAIQQVGYRNQMRIEVSRETPAHLKELFERLWPRAKVGIGSTMQQSRAVKSSLELELIRGACEVAQIGMEAAIDNCIPGSLEFEVAAAAEEVMRREGIEGYAFSTIVSAGRKTGVLYETATMNRVEADDMVMIDLGCTLNCYNSEFTRTVVLGEPEKRLLEAYRATYIALQAALDHVRAGVAASAVDAAARLAVRNAGFEDFMYGHATGHGIGTAVWESPLVGRDSEDVLLEDMVVAIEPAIYIPNLGGVRLEENVVVTETGCEVLTSTPFELQLIA